MRPSVNYVKKSVTHKTHLCTALKIELSVWKIAMKIWSGPHSTVFSVNHKYSFLICQSLRANKRNTAKYSYMVCLAEHLSTVERTSYVFWAGPFKITRSDMISETNVICHAVHKCIHFLCIWFHKYLCLPLWHLEHLTMNSHYSSISSLHYYYMVLKYTTKLNIH